MSVFEKNNEKEREIDLIELVRKIWTKRWFVLKVAAVGFVVGIIIAFSMPKEYTTEVILAPESVSESEGSTGMLAAMAGINLKDKGGTLPPSLFPSIASSSPFIVGLFDIRVTDTKSAIDTTLYAYMKDKQKSTWWSVVLGLPFRGIGLLFGSNNDKQETSSSKGQSTIITLTKEQSAILAAIKGRINISVDNKTDVITLTTTMQSPEISAYIADTVINYLQAYVIKFRTEKARNDLFFAEKMFKESQDNYYKIQQEYATFLDQNLNITKSFYKTKEERLRRELDLSYNLYNQMAQQLQGAKVKVQDITPVYSVVQPPVVPLQASSPRKILIIVGFAFFAAFVACAWVLAKDYLVELKKSSNKNK